MFRSLSVLVFAILLSGCSAGHVSFPVSAEAQERLVEDVEIIRLNADNIASFTRPARGHRASDLPATAGWNYTVGPGDVLSVIVFDHPELTLPAGEQRTAEESGFRVQADGTFFYPFIGQVRAAGRAPEHIRVEITQRLAEFIPSPQLDVRVAAYNSQRVVVAGEVGTPNRQRLTSVPLTLIEAVNAAGGLTDAADPRRVAVQRANRVHEVDLQGYLEAGIARNNPILRNGDVVNVPRRRAEEAYLLGQLMQPDTIDLSREPVSLTQAVTRKGGLNELRADARGIFVFRANGTDRITVFQLDTQTPTGIVLGTRFILEPGDVVYVVRSPLQRWNDTISRLLPTVRAIPAVESVVN